MNQEGRNEEMKERRSVSEVEEDQISRTKQKQKKKIKNEGYIKKLGSAIFRASFLLATIRWKHF